MILFSFLLAYLQGPETTVNDLFSDGAVLQRDRPVPVFGTGPIGRIVYVTLGEEVKRTRVDQSGRWLVRFAPRPARSTATLYVDGELVARDVIFGDVWLASGQSNMEWPVSQSRETELAVSRARASIRFYHVDRVSSETPLSGVPNRWETLDDTRVRWKSAVAFWFADRLETRLNVPIGIIQTAWGGTPVESWISRPALRSTPVFQPQLAAYERNVANFDAVRRAYERELADYQSRRQDLTNAGEFEGWQRENFADQTWQTVNLPTSLEVALGRNFDGIVWFRRTFTLREIPAEGAILELGPVDDIDTTYVNGQTVGSTSTQTANHWMVPRRYRIPPNLLRVGVNTIAVRVTDFGVGGGFTGDENQLRLTRRDGTLLAPLNGAWRMRTEREFAGEAPREPFGPGHPWVPGGLFNAMVAPLAPYGVRGAIWYQGESNTQRAEQYRTLFPLMIQDWRRAFGQDFPFLYVQLANFMARAPQPGPSDWAELRESQDQTLAVPRTGMVTAIDIGEANDIHPRDKRTVGERLANLALNDVYGIRTPSQGPRFLRATFNGPRAIVEFQHGVGLRTRDGRPPQGFAVRSGNGPWRWATARIEGTRIVLTSPQVTKPTAIRYLWAHNPDANLVNQAGLPALPFRTDRDRLTTHGNR